MKLKALAAAILIAAGVAVLMTLLFKVSPKDRQEYACLWENSRTGDDEKKECSLKQERIGVSKEIWLGEGVVQKEILLLCPQSQLHLSPLEEGGIVENMSEARFWMQEELYLELPEGKEAVLQPDGSYLTRGDNQPVSPQTNYGRGQIVRFLTAVTASYYPKAQRLDLHDIYLERIRAKGTLLSPGITPLAILLTGRANSAILYFQPTPSFQVDRLKATLYDRKSRS